MEVYHVLPINDVWEHTEEKNCLCEPESEIHENGIVIIHNAFDEREKYE